MHHFKFLLMYALALPQWLGLTLGGPWLFLGLSALLLVLVVGDALLGEDTSTPDDRPPGWLNMMLYLALVPVVITNLLQIWLMVPGDLLGYGAWVTGLTGYDVLAAKAGNPLMGEGVSLLACGLLTSMLGTIVAHELVHRTWHRPSLILGRWLLAFSWDSGFAIEHVYGHHRHVATPQDPASAPRGRTVYTHILRSTWEGNLSAWRIEAKRLALRRKPLLSLHNRFVRGQLMSLALLLSALLLAGWVGGLVFLASAAIAKAFLEMVNYLEHYGLVRDPACQVQPRHSWNSTRRISSWASFNLTRHSHHHATAQLPFQRLAPMPEAPTLPAGYLGTLMLTLVPPLWRRVMAPRLAHWDAHHASEAERALLKRV
ncbi:alkane 1-monooxygenase [Ferrimonas balearica]|uniref:alkane 1-monooxygenase n=1 Tax=Ferrimonas balearica TaxID=44012 RepID=UPI001C998D57|nr:alkane 1-monooxygenase [Ferrimonas balearica]MBY5992531.1 alkane 1-monooxygenase [Ferrimonas balearica]